MEPEVSHILKMWDTYALICPITKKTIPTKSGWFNIKFNPNY